MTAFRPLDSQLEAVPLAELSTIWSNVLAAHGTPDTDQREAQTRFIERYQGAIYRYFLRALRDPDAAADLFQEFALRFVRGAFRQADPQRGPFRNYLKLALIHLIKDVYRQRAAQGRQIALSLSELADRESQQGTANVSRDGEASFEASWREELLARGWVALRDEQLATDRPYFSLLKLKVDQPTLTAAELAQRLAAELAHLPPLPETAVRKLLQRARESFADWLLDEVAQTLTRPSREELESELIALQLHGYCRDALTRRFPGTA